MFPLEPDGKTFWPRHKATAKYKEIFAQAREQILARDRSYGIPEDGAVCFQSENGGQIVMKVNPQLAAMKHSADELHALAQSMWDEFCDSPRDSAEFVVKRPARVKREPMDTTIGGFTGPSLPEIKEDGSGVPQVRRGPGRPRKLQMSNL